jgi:hypothetical protein
VAMSRPRRSDHERVGLGAEQLAIEARGTPGVELNRGDPARTPGS